MRNNDQLFDMVKSVVDVQQTAYREGFKAGMRAAYGGQCLCVRCGEPVPSSSIWRTICDPCKAAVETEQVEPGVAADFPRPESMA